MFERGNPYRHDDLTGHQNEAAGEPGDLVEFFNRVIAAYLLGQENDKLQEDKEYEKLYEEYRLKNPEIPEDPYMEVIVSAGFGRTAIVQQRRIDFDTLQGLVNQPSSLDSSKPPILPQNQIPTTAPAAAERAAAQDLLAGSGISYNSKSGHFSSSAGGKTVTTTVTFTKNSKGEISGGTIGSGSTSISMSSGFAKKAAAALKAEKKII